MGVGKQIGRYSLSGLYGVVPSEVAGGPFIETITLRQTWRFYQGKRIDFYSGFNIFHVMGLEYETSKFEDPPEGYYPIGSIRGLLYLGSSFRLGKASRNSFFFEGGLNDIWVVNWLTNQGTINPVDQVSLALGLKSEF